MRPTPGRARSNAGAVREGVGGPARYRPRGVGEWAARPGGMLEFAFDLLAVVGVSEMVGDAVGRGLGLDERVGVGVGVACLVGVIDVLDASLR